MELKHQGGAEGESLLRPEHRNATITKHGNHTTSWQGEGEKAPFLRNEPVRLTPAWEGANLPNDTLNLKGIAMELAPPKDKWRLIYLTLLVHGIGTLISWNMFITARSYFLEYKLQNASKEDRDSFLPNLGLAAQVPNLLFSWFNVFVKIGGDLQTRIVWSLSIEVLVFVVTVVLAMVDSSQWTIPFYWITMVCVFILCGFNAIFQNSVFGIAARLPPHYTGAVILGSNVCGTLVVFIGWISDALSDNHRTSAIYYFIMGMFVLLVCFDTYFALPLNRFYRYHETLRQRTLRVNPALAATQQDETVEKTPYLTILRQSWVQLYNVFIIFFVTLSIFPSVHSGIMPSQEGFLGKEFVRITCFLTFNLTAMVGSITASLFQFPSRRWLWVFTTLRVLFIPFFVLCKYMPESRTRTLPIYVTNDWAYWIVAAFFGWSSGHGSSLGMMYVSGTVAPENAATAGMLGGAMLITGITLGIAFSYVFPVLVSLEVWNNI